MKNRATIESMYYIELTSAVIVILFEVIGSIVIINGRSEFLKYNNFGLVFLIASLIGLSWALIISVFELSKLLKDHSQLKSKNYC